MRSSSTVTVTPRRFDAASAAAWRSDSRVNGAAMLMVCSPNGNCVVPITCCATVDSSSSVNDISRW